MQARFPFLTFQSEFRPRPPRPGVIAGLLLLCLPVLAEAAPYELGRGYPLPFLGLTAGGYASFQASALEHQHSQATIQDLSLFLRGDPRPDWHVFSEIEISNPLTLTRDKAQSGDVDLDFERLYVDHNLSARDTLRIGKFLTPVGRWNQIHADPLVWTVSRPLTTSAAFAHNAAGLQFYGGLPLRSAVLDYRVYLDDTALLDRSEAHERTFPDLTDGRNPPNAFQRGGGVRLQYRSLDSDWSAGLSAAHFQLKELPGAKDLAGADFFYSWRDNELTGETVYRHDEDANGRTEWGWFLQWVTPIRGAFYGVLTHEHYKAELYDRPIDSTSIGLTYRPSPPIAIKLERRESTGEERLAPDGWLFSAAFLF